MPLHPLINFEIQRYHQKESKFKDVYLNCLPEIKDWEYVINLDEHEREKGKNLLDYTILFPPNRISKEG